MKGILLEQLSSILFSVICCLDKWDHHSQPAASIPVGFTDDGLPVGLQIVGRRFAEKTVLRASACFEAARPWADRWPAL